jgi:hypothetical protein
MVEYGAMCAASPCATGDGLSGWQTHGHGPTYRHLLVEGVRLATQLPEEGCTKKALANGQRFQQVVGKDKPSRRSF